MYTKAERKQLRQLAEIAHERELALELTRLQTRFSTWQRGEIDPFQLSEAIHAFHQGPSRTLYSYYNQIDPPLAVARAVVEKLLQENEIPAGIQQKLAAAIAFYRAEQKENG
jgi:hypothetical protein